MRDKKEFKFRLKIFFWYLCTEPVRQVKEVLEYFLRMLGSFNKTITWIYIFSIFAVMSLIKGNKPYASLFLVALIFIILMWEYQRGYFMHRYRQKVRKDIRTKLKEENGGKRK